MAGFVKAHLDKHPGTAVVLSGVGARRRHLGIHRELIQHATQLLLTRDMVNCPQAALVNAVYAVNGKELEERVSELVLADESLWRNVKPIGALLHRAPHPRQVVEW